MPKIVSPRTLQPPAPSRTQLSKIHSPSNGISVDQQPALKSSIPSPRLSPQLQPEQKPSSACSNSPTSVTVNDSQTDTVANVNGTGAVYKHAQDYTKCEKMTGKPEVGMVIAYRVN